MSELDFDELDKAVSALMGDVSSSTPRPPKRDDGTKTITIPSTLPENATLPQNNPTTSVGGSSRGTNEASKMHTEPTTRTADMSSVTTTPREEVAAGSAPAVEQKPEAPAQSAVVSERQTLPARRSGRFMDVVHPSSDMKNPLNTAPSSRPTRTGVSLEPMSSVASVVTEASEADVAVQKDAPETQEVSPKPQVEEPAPEQHDWPDPLASFKELETEPETASATSGEQVRDDEATAADEAALTALIDEPEKEPLPLVSPFLANTKVEKRPLGGSLETAEASDETAPSEQEASLPEENETPEEEQLPVDPVKTAAKASLPAELQTDLVAIESDSGGFTEEAPADELKNTPSVSEKVAPAPSAAPVKKVQPQPQQRIGVASISPQYKETASTGDQSNGSIYDTAAYHQPLAHPPKKKSGWLWVIWVLLLLVLGGGGAAALYYAGLI